MNLDANQPEGFCVLDVLGAKPSPGFHGSPWMPVIAGLISLAGILNDRYHALGGSTWLLAGWPW
jgi:hypothetical protein